MFERLENGREETEQCNYEMENCCEGVENRIGLSQKIYGPCDFTSGSQPMVTRWVFIPQK